MQFQFCSTKVIEVVQHISHILRLFKNEYSKVVGEKKKKKSEKTKQNKKPWSTGLTNPNLIFAKTINQAISTIFSNIIWKLEEYFQNRVVKNQ